MHYEDTDCDRHFLLVDQPVEYLRSVELDTVLIDVDTGGGFAVELGRDVDPAIAHSARKDLAVTEGELDNLPRGRFVAPRGRLFTTGHRRRDRDDREDEESRDEERHEGPAVPWHGSNP